MRRFDILFAAGLINLPRYCLSPIYPPINREFLPPLLGVNLMKETDILLLNNGFYRGYNDSIKAGIYNEFATAVLR